VPDPQLNIDEVKISPEIYLKLYEDKIKSELDELEKLEEFENIKDYYKKIKFILEIDKETHLKSLAPEDEVVLLKRDPVLHKYSILAYKPIMDKAFTKLKVIKISPLVCKGYNADFDGDTMVVVRLYTKEAKEEAMFKMLPSQNIYSVADGKEILYFDQDYKIGKYKLKDMNCVSGDLNEKLKCWQKYLNKATEEGFSIKFHVPI